MFQPDTNIDVMKKIAGINAQYPKLQNYLLRPPKNLWSLKKIMPSWGKY